MVYTDAVPLVTDLSFHAINIKKLLEITVAIQCSSLQRDPHFNP